MAKAATAEKPVETMDDTAGKPDKGMMLPPQRLATPDFGWRTFEATVPVNTPPDWIGEGWYWRLCARQLHRGDHIKWRDDSLTRYGELVVVSIDAATGNIETRELWRREIAPAATRVTENTGFTPVDFGVHEKWGVVRDADGHVMCKGCESCDEAMRRIRVEYTTPRRAGRGSIGGRA